MTEPIPGQPTSVAVLTVLYHNDPQSIRRSVLAFDNAARLGREADLCSGFVVALGDASDEPSLSEDFLKDLRGEASHLDEVRYTHFGENTGTSRGQNRLSREASADLLVLCNPDVVTDGRAPWRMAAILDDPAIGLVEAKQLPVEHPKDYELGTGFVSWGSGAFSMVPRRVFEEVGGFDEDTFFLYCDDVDLSWRIREAGYEVVFQPGAIVFHGKHLSPEGGWLPTSAERYYSAEAALLLAHKWSRSEIVEKLLADFANSEDLDLRRARDAYLERAAGDRLPAPRDPDHLVGVFAEGNYAPQRYVL